MLSTIFLQPHFFMLDSPQALLDKSRPDSFIQRRLNTTKYKFQKILSTHPVYNTQIRHKRKKLDRPSTQRIKLFFTRVNIIM